MNSKLLMFIDVIYTTLTKSQICACTYVFVLAFFMTNQSITAQNISYQELSAQEQADLSRWLGWVWGDGIPLDLEQLTGIKYTGPTNSNFSNRYDAVVQRLVTSPINIALGNGGTNTRRVLEPWDFWIDGIPGGNENDPQILRDAVQNPNFLAGIIDTEGGNCGNTNNDYYIDDHFYAPSHPDNTKGWGLLNFKPGRMVQLYHLLGNVYGFEKTAIQIGTHGDKYIYGIESDRRLGIQEVYEEFEKTKMINEAAANQDEAQTKRVRIYIDNEDWETFRSYGYWNNPKRYPSCNNPVTSLIGTFPLVNLALANPDWLDNCELVQNGFFNQEDASWTTFLFENADASLLTANGYAEIAIQTLGSSLWHINIRQTNLVLAQGKSYQISYDAFADDARPISVVARSDQGNGGYFFKNQTITTDKIRYTHDFTMTAETDSISYLSFNVGNHLTHSVYFDNISVKALDCVCPDNRFIHSDISNSIHHFESNTLISADNVINGYSISYDAGQQVELEPRFEVILGATFEAYIDGCFGN